MPRSSKPLISTTRVDGRPSAPTVATVIAFVVGYAVIAWLMKFITTNSYMPFVWYRIALGLGLFALLGTGVISA